MRTRRRLHNQDGQMAIFVALIFQVLFVFFAMVINIGLLIHDKINLQNSVDLGAYYAAQRQAEMLNHIAHINYQIRQSYKLMVWRYRVLGSFGLQDHPFRTGQNLTEAEYDKGGAPAVCLAHSWWRETALLGQVENLCRVSELQIPAIPQMVLIPGSYGFNNGIAERFEMRRMDAARRCEYAGPLNWAFAANIMYAFMEDVGIRKRMIQNLANNLNGRATDFTDLNGDSVLEGVRKTIEKNLTEGNKNRGEGFEVELLNSMGMEPCNKREVWLPEIKAYPLIRYTDFTPQSSTACPGTNKFLNQLPVRYNAFRGQLDSTGALRRIAEFDLPEDDPRQPIRGFEKNPWCMSYVGVRVKTKTRKPFSPFGGAIQLEARAFAQPFGGRIGPWDSKQWPRQSPFSVGEPVDPLAVPRTLPGGTTTPSDVRMMPNYSRFPGDVLGLRSRLALGAGRQEAPGRPILDAAFGNEMLNLDFYTHFIGQMEAFGDPLAWNSRTNTEPAIRTVERAMISPDVFDIAYYSIEPKYYDNYLEKTRPRITGVRPISDLGSRTDEATPEFLRFGVFDQVDSFMDPNRSQFQTGMVFWIVKNFSHVLTGWTQKSVSDYGFPTEQFGKCQVPATPELPNPGNCVLNTPTAGHGRTGYSIRLVARDYLLFREHQLGNDGNGNSFLNPPPRDF